VTCQRSPEPVFLRTKETPEGDPGEFYVRSGPGTVKLSPQDTDAYVRTRFPARPSAGEARPPVAG
jgi:hypothetical protein